MRHNITFKFNDGEERKELYANDTPLNTPRLRNLCRNRGAVGAEARPEAIGTILRVHSRYVTHYGI